MIKFILIITILIIIKTEWCYSNEGCIISFKTNINKCKGKFCGRIVKKHSIKKR
jgi:hypothetical protein